MTWPPNNTPISKPRKQPVSWALSTKSWLCPFSVGTLILPKTCGHRIINSAAIQSQAITVTCADGVVELTGTVHSWSEREEASLLASEVIGVKRIKNDLLVEWEAYRSDAAIKKDVLAALGRDAYLVNMPIDVSVTDGRDHTQRHGGKPIPEDTGLWRHSMDRERSRR